MDRKVIIERLSSLASDNKTRSKADRLRDVIDYVEAALAAGVPRISVVEELTKNGLEMTLATFETTLKRIRQKRGKPSIKMDKLVSHTSQPSNTSPPLKLDESDTVTENLNNNSHNPTDLNKIIESKPDLAALARFAKRKKI